MKALLHSLNTASFGMGRFCCCVFLTLSAASACAESVVFDPELVRILSSLDVQRDEPRAYSEYRMTTRLREPLKITGDIVFSSQGELIKRVIEPFQETITIGNNLVRVQRVNKMREFSMAKDQGLYDFFRSLRAMLEGDIDTLDELFVVAIERDGDNWTLICKPKNKYLRRYVLEMNVSGTADEITEIFIDQGRKRWQRLSFSVVEAQRP
jgi:hypothetical protein